MAKKPTASATRASTAARAAKPAAVSQAHDHASDHGHGPASVGTAEGNDYAAHEATFHGFTTLVKWSILALFVLVIFLFVVVHPLIRP